MARPFEPRKILKQISNTQLSAFFDERGQLSLPARSVRLKPHSSSHPPRRGGNHGREPPPLGERRRAKRRRCCESGSPASVLCSWHGILGWARMFSSIFD